MATQQTKTFDDFERLARRTMHTDHQTWREQFANAALGVGGEAGEVSDIVKKLLFHKKGISGAHCIDGAAVDHLLEEIGDVLFYLSWTAQLVGSSLAECAEINNEKLMRRWPNGFVPKNEEGN